MMEATRSLSEDVHTIIRGGQTQEVQFIPQIISTLRLDLVFWSHLSEGEKFVISIGCGFLFDA